MLNPNHGNCFAKIGQAAFNPAHFVPGIGPSPDKMLQGRLFFLPNDTIVPITLCWPVSHPARSKPGQLQPRRLNAHRRRWGNNYEDSIASVVRKGAESKLASSVIRRARPGVCPIEKLKCA